MHGSNWFASYTTNRTNFARTGRNRSRSVSLSLWPPGVHCSLDVPDKGSVERYQQAIAQAKAAGGQVVTGEKVLEGKGNFVAPTIIRARNADGSWYEPFSPTDETGFQEGNSWQYSWLAMHDARKLMELMGGDQAAIDQPVEHARDADLQRF